MFEHITGNQDIVAGVRHLRHGADVEAQVAVATVAVAACIAGGRTADPLVQLALWSEVEDRFAGEQGFFIEIGNRAQSIKCRDQYPVSDLASAFRANRSWVPMIIGEGPTFPSADVALCPTALQALQQISFFLCGLAIVAPATQAAADREWNEETHVVLERKIDLETIANRVINRKYCLIYTTKNTNPKSFHGNSDKRLLAAVVRCRILV